MDAYRLVLEQEIRTRRAVEQWYRFNIWAAWHDLRSENLAILRVLLRMRREAKRAERIAQEHREREERRLVEDWTEAEKAAAWGYA